MIQNPWQLSCQLLHPVVKMLNDMNKELKNLAKFDLEACLLRIHLCI